MRWTGLSLTRSLFEASADCLWLVDPGLDLNTRLRRTNQMFFRACSEMARILPDPQEKASRFLSVDPTARVECLKAKESSLKWARAQGWSCTSGKYITPGRWIGEIPSHTKMVALVGQGESGYWEDVYRMLSGVTHSQPLLMTLSLNDRPDSDLDRALMVLDMGISFYCRALIRFAEFMGWNDHDIEHWFLPVHLAIQHIRTPEDIPIPNFSIKRCEVCPDYQEPYMHRLALVSHLCALLERNIDQENTGNSDAPTRFSLAVEFLEEIQQLIMKGSEAESETQQRRKAFGAAHSGILRLFGSEQSELFTSIAAYWAVLRSPDYQSDVGKIQGWTLQTEDPPPQILCDNE